MTRRLRILLAAAVLVTSALMRPAAIQAQQVQWALKVTPVEEGLSQLDITANISEGWHIYDTLQIDAGPNATVVSFALPKGAAAEGPMSISPASTVAYDDIFGCDIGTWEGKVVFSQKVRHNAGGKVTVSVEYMTCGNGACSMPVEEELSAELTAGPFPPSGAESGTEPGTESAAATDGAQPASSTGTAAASAGSLWAMILEAILWGFAALLTPCVFPMVPMTVSFFIKGSENRARGRFRAIMYGVFIVLLYTVPIAAIIIITRLVGGDAVTADIFNWLATHWIPNILFFVIFMVFAASFFGAFEITMPGKLVNKSDKASEKKQGLGGVFFMALTLVLVSFSCTGPIVGTVLIKSTSGEFWAPIVTMFAFSLAFALPFMLFALFPGMLKKLPGSGGWLNSVKVVLGFIEIALGFKFLSTADQVYHWGLLNREVYLAIWITVFTLLGFYLLGKLRFKYDSELKHISVLRLTLAIASFSFVVWMIPGMWGAPLKALSGYLPPIETQEFVIDRYAAPRAVGPAAEGKTIKYSDILEAPLGMSAYFDLTQAREAAAEAGKPLFIAFTGHGCVNCREMEARVWSDSRVRELMQEKYVLCLLYCDDKLQAAQEDWLVTDSGRTLKTIGKINSYIANRDFGVNAQPFYVLQAPDGGTIGTRGYNLDVEAFVKWLQQ